MTKTRKEVKIAGTKKDRLVLCEREFTAPGFKPVVGFEVHYLEYAGLESFGSTKKVHTYNCCNSEVFATYKDANAAFNARRKSENPFITVSQKPGAFWRAETLLNMERV